MSAVTPSPTSIIGVGSEASSTLNTGDANNAAKAPHVLAVDPATSLPFTAAYDATLQTTNTTLSTINTSLTSGAQKAQGNVASGTADSGNPVKVGGVYNIAAPTLSNGQRGDAQLDVNGNVKVAIATGAGAVSTNPRALEAQYDWTTSAVALGILNAPQGLGVTVNSGSGTSRNYAVVAVGENGDSVPCATVAASGGATANDTLSWQESPGAIGYRPLVNGNVVTAYATTPLPPGTLAYTYTSGATSAYTAATAGPRTPLPVRQEPTTATPGVTRLAASVTSATNSTALAGARKWSLYNESSNGTLYILKASGTASATNYSDLPIAPGGYLTEETAPYQGPLSYVWVGAVGGSAVLTVGV